MSTLRMIMVASKHVYTSCTDVRANLEVVASKHHPNNVFTNVMDIALDCGHDDDSSIVLRGVATSQLLLFYVGQQVPHCLLHHSC